MADISVELASRGKDDEYQEKTEKYAHANDSWLQTYLNNMIKKGLIKKGRDGGYLPPAEFKPNM